MFAATGTADAIGVCCVVVAAAATAATVVAQHEPR